MMTKSIGVNKSSKTIISLFY